MPSHANLRQRAGRSNNKIAAALASHPPTVNLREDAIVSAINGWIGQLFHPAQREQTVAALLGAQPAAQAIGTDDAKARRADADQRLRRYHAAIAAGVDPEAMVEAINQAQAERRAAQAEIDSAPAAAVLAAADVHAMIDSFGDVGAALDEGRPAALDRLYRALDLGVRYEPGERAAYVTRVTARVWIVRVSEGDLRTDHTLGDALTFLASESARSGSAASSVTTPVHHGGRNRRARMPASMGTPAPGIRLTRPGAPGPPSTVHAA